MAGNKKLPPQITAKGLPSRHLIVHVNDDGIPFCGGKKKRDGGLCMRSPGWGTNHRGSGHCKLHGGNAPGAEKGNRNALKTGVNAIIPVDPLANMRDILDADDIPSLTRNVGDAYATLCRQLQIEEIRRDRMMRRVAQYKRTLAESPDGMAVESVTIESGGYLPDGTRAEDKTTIKRSALIDTIQRIDSDLTKVVLNVAKLIEHKAKMDALQNDQSNGRTDLLGQLIVTIETAAKQTQTQHAALRNVTDESDDVSDDTDNDEDAE